MSRRILNALSGSNTTNTDNPPKANDTTTVKQTIINILRATLSASAVTYHEAIEESGLNNKDETTTTPEAKDDDMEEAIRRSLVNGRNFGFETELETFQRTNENRMSSEEENSSTGAMTPNSRLSRPSTSSGLFQEDLSEQSSSEFP